MSLSFVSISILSVHATVFFLEEITTKTCMGFMLEIGRLIELIERGLNSLVSFGWTETTEPGIRLWLGLILFEDRFCGVSLNFGD